MLKVDDVMRRVLQLEPYASQQWDAGDFIPQVIPNTYSLPAINSGTYGSVSQQTMQFPAGAIIVGMAAGASNVGAASTGVQRPGLEMFTIGLQYQQTRSVIGPGNAMAVSVFGPYNDLFPEKEIIIPQNGSLLVNLTSLVTDAIAVWITAHCLVPNQVS